MSAWGEGEGIVELPDGRRVRGTGMRRPREGAPAPEFGLYLLARDPQIRDWPHRWVHWRDFKTPTSTQDAVGGLYLVHERALTDRVEIACGSGIGRTGTALAMLAVLGGVEPDDAVSWVREHYHPQAVETRGQERWVRRVGARVMRPSSR